MPYEPPDDATLMRFPAAGEGPTGGADGGVSAGLASADNAASGLTPPGGVLPGDDAPLGPGERVGPYEIRDHIGDGGMASVYRAWHTGLHRFEALKIPRQQGRYGPEAAFVRRLLTEARTVAGLHHPHIALIHAVSEAESPLQYFAMELVDGGDLAQLIQAKGKVPPEEAVPILRQVAEALDYAHANGVVHRDIKPANVLLTPEGSAKVVDFGISRAGEEAGGTRLTRSGMIVGTPEYMSPEQSGSGDPVTHRTDIYSLGVVAYEMLCGTPPFVAGEGVNRLSILMKHLGEAPASPLRSTPGFGPAATEALLTALAKKPEERFSTCGEFVAALARSLQKRGHTQIMPAGGTPENVDNAVRPITRSLSERTSETLPPEEETAKKTLPIPRPTPKRRPGALITGVSALALCVLLLLGWWRRNSNLAVVNPAGAPVTSGQGRIEPVVLPGRPTPTAIPIPTATTAPTPREVKRIETQHTAVPFKDITRQNASLPRNTRRIVRRGRAGVREMRVEVSRLGSDETSRRVLSDRVLRAPVDQVTELGTKAPTVKAAAPKPHDAARVKTPVVAKTTPHPKAKAPSRSKARPAPHRRAARQRVLRRRPVVRTAVRRRVRAAAPHRSRPRSSPRRSYGREAPLPP